MTAQSHAERKAARKQADTTRKAEHKKNRENR